MPCTTLPVPPQVGHGASLNLPLPPQRLHTVAPLAGVPKAALAGGATTILALIVVGLIVTHSSVFGKFSVESITTLALVLLAGPVIYLIARAVRSGSSIDLDLAMRELPPE